MQALAETLVLERLLDSWALTYISPFRMLMVQQLHNLSDEELEFQVNDRRSFKKFVGLSVMHSIPDATTMD